jgi:hypothetical protein
MYVKQGIATTTVDVTMFPTRRRRRVVDRGVRGENGKFAQTTLPFLLYRFLKFLLGGGHEKWILQGGMEWGTEVAMALVQS